MYVTGLQSTLLLAMGRIPGNVFDGVHLFYTFSIQLISVEQMSHNFK